MACKESCGAAYMLIGLILRIPLPCCKKQFARPRPGLTLALRWRCAGAQVRASLWALPILLGVRSQPCRNQQYALAQARIISSVYTLASYHLALDSNVVHFNRFSSGIGKGCAETASLTEACCHERRGRALRHSAPKRHRRESTLKTNLQRLNARGVPQAMLQKWRTSARGRTAPTARRPRNNPRTPRLLHDGYQRFADVAVLARGVRHDEGARICRWGGRDRDGQTGRDRSTPLELVPFQGTESRQPHLTRSHVFV